MTKHIWNYGLAFLLLFSPALLRAEVEKTLSVSTVYDNNAYGDYTQAGDYITQFTGTLSTWYGKRPHTQFSYIGEGALFAQAGERTFTRHNTGFFHIQNLNGKNRLYVGSTFSLRLGRSDYLIYNYAGLKSYLSSKWYLTPSTILRTGYTLQVRNYWNLTASRLADHYVFAQINKTWPTRTTLRGDLNYGYKTHNGTEAQVVLGLQIAQSLTANTGISLRYQNRINTTARQPAQTTADLLLEDTDIFNDRYDYSGHEWTTRLTQQLPERARLILEAGYEIRNYQKETTLELLGLALDPIGLRKDRNTFFSLTLEKPIGETLNLNLGYEYQKNRSNDFYYNYFGRHNLSVDLEAAF